MAIKEFSAEPLVWSWLSALCALIICISPSCSMFSSSNWLSSFFYIYILLSDLGGLPCERHMRLYHWSIHSLHFHRWMASSKCTLADWATISKKKKMFNSCALLSCTQRRKPVTSVKGTFKSCSPASQLLSASWCSQVNCLKTKSSIYLPRTLSQLCKAKRPANRRQRQFWPLFCRNIP